MKISQFWIFRRLWLPYLFISLCFSDCFSATNEAITWRKGRRGNYYSFGNNTCYCDSALGRENLILYFRYANRLEWLVRCRVGRQLNAERYVIHSSASVTLSCRIHSTVQLVVRYTCGTRICRCWIFLKIQYIRFELKYSTRHLLCIKTPLKHMQFWCTIKDEYCSCVASCGTSPRDSRAIVVFAFVENWN